MHTIDTSVTIAATPRAVWDIVVDFASYVEWNPFIQRASGVAEVGTVLTVEIKPAGGKAMTHRPTVLVADPGERLQWLGKVAVPGLFAARHEFVLQPDGDGTHVQHREEFRGLLVPFLKGTLRQTEAGFEAMNQALKERAER